MEQCSIPLFLYRHIFAISLSGNNKQLNNFYKLNVNEMENLKLLTRAQVAKRWGISQRCLLNWRKDDKLPYIKMKRRVYFRLSDIIQWEQDHRIIES